MGIGEIGVQEWMDVIEILSWYYELPSVTFFFFDSTRLYQKLTGKTVFSFFEVGSSGEVQCFEGSLVSVVYYYIHVSSKIRQRYRNCFGFCLNCASKCGAHRADSFLMAIFQEDMVHIAFWDVSWLVSAISNDLLTSVCQYEIMYFCPIMLHGSRVGASGSAFRYKNKHRITNIYKYCFFSKIRGHTVKTYLLVWFSRNFKVVTYENILYILVNFPCDRDVNGRCGLELFEPPSCVNKICWSHCTPKSLLTFK